MLHVQWVQFQDLIFCLNMANLLAVLISSLRLFPSRLPLHFNEFVPHLCDVAGGSSQSSLILKSYSTTSWWKDPTYMEDLSGSSSYIIPPLVFANFSCEVSKFPLFTSVHQAPLCYYYHELFSLHVLSFYLSNYQLLYCKQPYQRAVLEIWHHDRIQ